ncbi:MAG: phosphoribosylformylglycinamidine synthase subunit PurS [Nitrospirales bacterium]|nr:phosphoribosylformylglycinamidine synthase subunit PurS [Nitrospira sp.]MDR4502785.1 phosphoribosylformylglycinamidine synthase subunit PurS [Nitrospirales bacterium]
MKATIYVTLKPGIHDPQGHAIRQSLATLGFESVSGVRMGKLLEIDLQETDQGKAEAAIQSMCDKLLTNPVIEDYRFEVSP